MVSPKTGTKLRHRAPVESFGEEVGQIDALAMHEALTAFSVRAGPADPMHLISAEKREWGLFEFFNTISPERTVNPDAAGIIARSWQYCGPNGQGDGE